LKDYTPARSFPFVTLALVATWLVFFAVVGTRAQDVSERLEAVRNACYKYWSQHTYLTLPEDFVQTAFDGQRRREVQAALADQVKPPPLVIRYLQHEQWIIDDYVAAYRTTLAKNPAFDWGLVPSKPSPAASMTYGLLFEGVLPLGLWVPFFILVAPFIEASWGRVKLILLIAATNAGAGLLKVALAPHETLPTVGAGPAIAGVAGAFLIQYYGRPVRLSNFLGGRADALPRSSAWVLPLWFAALLGGTRAEDYPIVAAALGLGGLFGLIVRYFEAEPRSTLIDPFQVRDRSRPTVHEVGDATAFGPAGGRKAVPVDVPDEKLLKAAAPRLAEEALGTDASHAFLDNPILTEAVDLIQLGKVQDARRVLEAARATDPSNPETHEALWHTYELENRPQLGAPHLLRAIETWLDIGRAQRAFGRWRTLVEAAEQAGPPALRQRLALALQGKNEVAREAVLRSLAGDELADTHGQQAALLFMGLPKEPEELERWTSRAQAHAEPADPVAAAVARAIQAPVSHLSEVLERALALLDAGDVAGAREAIGTPTDPEGLTMLWRTYVRQGNPQEGIDSMLAAIEAELARRQAVAAFELWCELRDTCGSFGPTDLRLRLASQLADGQERECREVLSQLARDYQADAVGEKAARRLAVMAKSARESGHWNRIAVDWQARIAERKNAPAPPDTRPRRPTAQVRTAAPAVPQPSPDVLRRPATEARKPAAAEVPRRPTLEIRATPPAVTAAPPKTPLAIHLESAQALEQGGDLKGARRALEQAFALDPERAETVRDLWRLCRRGGEPKAGFEHGARAVELYLGEDKPSDAHAVWKELKAAGHSLSAALSLRLARVLQGPDPDASRALLEEVALDGGSGRAGHGAATRLAAMAAGAEERDRWEAVGLARMQHHHREVPEPSQAIQPKTQAPPLPPPADIAAPSPSSKPVRPDLRQNTNPVVGRGLQLAEAGKLDEAMRVLQLGKFTDPDNGAIYHALFRTHLALGRTAEGAGYLLQAMEAYLKAGRLRHAMDAWQDLTGVGVYDAPVALRLALAAGLREVDEASTAEILAGLRLEASLPPEQRKVAPPPPPLPLKAASGSHPAGSAPSGGAPGTAATLKVRNLALEAVLEEGLLVRDSLGASGLLRYSRVEAVACGRITGDPEPWMVMDIITNWRKADPGIALRVLRLTSSITPLVEVMNADPNQVVDAHRMLLRAVASRSQSTVLPNAHYADGGNPPGFPSLEEYEAALLRPGS
jgi:tetratricopeptide (TPR) repeat protein/membrane associated rhomboid family serine protease